MGKIKRKSMVDHKGKPLFSNSVQPGSKPTDSSIVSSIRKVHEISSQPGNWNVNEYNRGMHNMAELILAGIENRQPRFKDVPQEGYIEQTTYADREIVKLAEFITNNYPDEPGKGGRNESAVDVVIRLLSKEILPEHENKFMCEDWSKVEANENEKPLESLNYTDYSIITEGVRLLIESKKYPGAYKTNLLEKLVRNQKVVYENAFNDELADSYAQAHTMNGPEKDDIEDLKMSAMWNNPEAD